MSIPKVESMSFYVDQCIRAGNKPVKLPRGLTPQEKERRRTRERIGVVVAQSDKILRRVGMSFPSIDALSEFQYALLKDNVDIVFLKKSLASLGWARKRISLFSREYQKRSDYRAFLGRFSSVFRQISKHLSFMDEARKYLNSLPVIDESLFTVCISGFPNAGKSTLLSKLTTAKPKVDSYEFTTTSVNLGYATIMHQRMQFVDTPGTLGRTKINIAEKQALYALQYLADLIILLVPADEDSEKHLKLLKQLRTYDKPLLVYLSKTDLAKTDLKVKETIVSSIPELRKELRGAVKEWLG